MFVAFHLLIMAVLSLTVGAAQESTETHVTFVCLAWEALLPLELLMQYPVPKSTGNAFVPPL